MIQALASSCPVLEHLSFSPWILPTAISPDSILELEKLVSVHFSGREARTVDWGWLEAIAERGQLEYLDVEPQIPFELLCRVVSKCSVCCREKGLKASFNVN